ncbi:MAG: glycosyltransferase family 4 protein, partial [Pyrinomonadaceae bacterium]|nr:glycosyltransferase family 4 protein [Pyrinomonadaceae bacterium]
VYHSTCDQETKYIRNMLGERASVVQIPNFIELPELKERSQQSYLLYLGRLDRKKAIDNLLRALKQSKVFAESNFVLKIAGRGLPEYEEYLTRLTADLGLGSKVEFLGQIGGDEKQQLLTDAYFTLMPSHTENFGNVVLESLAQNTPVLASTGTPWSELEQVRVGMWVENSPASLAASIDKMLSIPEEEYEAMRSRSRTFVEERYDIERNYHHWIDLYNQL